MMRSGGYSKYRGKKYIIRCLLSLSIAILISISFISDKAMGHKDIETEKPIKFSLSNGLRVILQKNTSSPVVAINLWVNCGSANESDEEAGISHFIEHMIFKGTEKRRVGEIARDIESRGGEINAYTSSDHTVYHIVLSKRFYEIGLDILSDAIANPAFDPEEIEREKQVVLEEIKRGEDSPDSRLTKVLFENAYSLHPYRRPVIGYERVIRNLTREHILNYYEKWYRPENMILVIVGDFDEKVMIPLIESYFTKIPGRKGGERKDPIEPEKNSISFLNLSGDIKQIYLKIGFHIPSVYNNDTYALEVLSSILSGGETSRLYRALKGEKILVTNIYTYAFTPKGPGLFIIGSSLEKDKLNDSLSVIFEEIERLKYQPVSQSELERAKINIESDFIYQKETMEGQARKIGYFESVFGDPDYEKKYIEGIKSVTYKEIMDVVKKYLNPASMTLVIMHPKDSPVTLDSKTLLKIAKDAEDKVRRKLSLKITKGDLDIVKHVLPNGVTLLIKENHAVPVVAFRAALLGGLRFENSSNNGISNFLSSLFTKGTTKYSALEFAEEIESIAGDISGFSGANSFGIRGEFLSRYWEKGFELLVDALLHPSLDPKEIEKKKEEILLAIKNQEDNLHRSAINLFLRGLFPNHPYGMNPLGTYETINLIKREDLLEFHRRYVKPDNLVIAVAGDIKSEDFIHKAEKLLGDFAGDKFNPPPIPHEQPISEPVKLFQERDKKQAHIVLGFRGCTIYDEDRYALQVLNAVLSGQGGRLFKELRDREGLAYALTSFVTEGLDPGYFGVYMATGPENIERAIDGIIRELKRIKDKGVSEEELERAKMYIVGGFEIDLQRNSHQASVLSFNELYGLGYNEIRDFPEKILNVKTEDVYKVANKYLDFNRYVLAIIRPSSSIIEK